LRCEVRSHQHRHGDVNQGSECNDPKTEYGENTREGKETRPWGIVHLVDRRTSSRGNREKKRTKVVSMAELKRL
jgi:hypothetical protein